MSSRNIRFSLESFNRFVPALSQIITDHAHHRVSQITTTPLTADTFVSRIRDSLHAYVDENPHWCAPFSADQCKKTFQLFKEGGDYFFSVIDKHTVRCGPKQSKAQDLDTHVASLETVIDHTQDVDGRDTAVVEAIALLLDREFIFGPIEIQKLDSKWVTEVEDKFPNVEFIENDDNTWTLL